MTAVSLDIARGVDGFKMSDVTVGATAPPTLDFSFAFNILDTNSHPVTQLDLVKALKAITRSVESRSGATGGNLYTALTAQPSGPPE